MTTTAELAATPLLSPSADGVRDRTWLAQHPGAQWRVKEPSDEAIGQVKIASPHEATSIHEPMPS